jgi:hypothetical protein
MKKVLKINHFTFEKLIFISTFAALKREGLNKII